MIFSWVEPAGQRWDASDLHRLAGFRLPGGDESVRYLPLCERPRNLADQFPAMREQQHPRTFRRALAGDIGKQHGFPAPVGITSNGARQPARYARRNASPASA